MRPNKRYDEVINRIVEAVNPLQILLFGSAARQEDGAESDVDLLVVIPEGTHCRKTAQHLHSLLFGIPYPVDILVATPSLLEKHKNNIGLIYREILREGQELYAA
ncbi:MAG: nucleotidyltransferase domain-containing protein [bacterium]